MCHLKQYNNKKDLNNLANKHIWGETNGKEKNFKCCCLDSYNFGCDSYNSDNI